jgi:hypothetical protein
MRNSRLECDPQRLTWTEHVLLSDDFFQRLRAKRFGKRRRGVVGEKVSHAYRPIPLSQRRS